MKKTILSHIIRVSSLVLLLAGVRCVPGQSATPRLTPLQAATAMLENIHENGFNPAPSVNGGLGGLWINWRVGVSPRQVNLNGSGAPDGPEVKRHDDLTDLRYLHCLYLYKKLCPGDTRFDADIDRFQKIFARTWSDSTNQRGWVFDEMISMARLSGDSVVRQAARNLAAAYATKMFIEPPGIYYKTRDERPGGNYRVDNTLEIGCALIQAGVEFKEPDWTEKGRRIVHFVYDHAYLEKFHAFPKQMDDVLLPDGRINPNERFYRSKDTNGGQVRIGETGQIITSLMHAYFATGDRLFLERAIDLLEPLLPEKNTLGLWDPVNLGYFGEIRFSGDSFANPGEINFRKSTKECGRQIHLLEGVLLVNAATGHRYQKLEDLLLRVALEKAYDPALRGLAYEKNADWSFRDMKNGTKGDWVTTEAMGIAAQVLMKYELGHRKPQ